MDFFFYSIREDAKKVFFVDSSLRGGRGFTLRKNIFLLVAVLLTTKSRGAKGPSGLSTRE